MAAATGWSACEKTPRIRTSPRRPGSPLPANGVWLSPAADSKAVFFVDGRKGDAGRHLRCVSPADGAERWKLPVAADASGEFVLLDGDGLIADGPRQLTCFHENGEVAWRAECGAVCGVPATSDALLAVATEQPPALLVLDRPSGATLWRVPLDAAPTAPPLVRNTIYLGMKSGVAAFRLLDGGRLWEAKSGPPSTPLVLAKNRLAYVTAAGELVVVGLRTAAWRRHCPAPWRASHRWPRPECLSTQPRRA